MLKRRHKGRRVRRNTDFDSPFEDKEPVEIGAPPLTEAEVPAEK